MDIVTFHTIKIFMLYVGIISAIQEQAYDHCHGSMFRLVYIYPNPMGHTLKSFTSFEYVFAMRSKREGTPKVVRGSLRMVLLYHEWFQKGLKPYQLYNGGVKMEKVPCDMFMESS
jgi:hypothetical protein